MRLNLLLTASLALSATAASNFTAASNVNERPSNATTDDGFILNFALTIEYLQRAFFAGGLASFQQKDFVDAGFEDPFYDNLQQIYADEQSHAVLLQNVLLAADIQATSSLTYDFPYVDVSSFVALASIISGVSVSAYLGSLASVDGSDYLTALASILTNEARHTSYLRASLAEAPFPTAYDTPLDFNETHTLAAAFIKDFDKATVHLPVVPFANLTLACTPYYYEADRSSVTFPNAFFNAQRLGITKDMMVYAVFLSGLMKLPVPVQLMTGSNDYTVSRIPAAVRGQTYVVLSTSDVLFSDQTIIAGPAIVEVYPKGLIPSTPHPACIVPSLGL